MIKRKLEQFAVHSFLLPVFFVLHNYLQYFGLVSVAAAMKVLAWVEFFFALFFFGVFLSGKHINRSAQLTTLAGFVFLFYGVIKDFFKATPPLYFMAKYSVLLPVLAVLLLLAVRIILKKNDFRKANLFQNTLLLLFLSSEIILLLYWGTAMYRQPNQLVKNNLLKPGTLAGSSKKPSVYFLVFDSYPGTDFLKTSLHYDNTPFDSALRAKGFYVARQPRSNYNRTALSMASTLNFEYLQGITDRSHIEAKHYNQASLSIEHAVVPAVFSKLGYKIYNLSFFDLAAYPSIMKENFLVLPDEAMLLYNTLPARFSQDIQWHFTGLFGNLTERSVPATQQKNFVTESIKKRNFNNLLIDSLKKIPLQVTTQPKFIYAHLYLPHPPFFYTSNGRPTRLDLTTAEKAMEDKTAFISYLEYTNKTIQAIVSVILNAPGEKPVIILQSDHGYRDFKKDFVRPALYFRNYAAFYFPDKNYSSLYDSISNINTFPVIFNRYFKTNITLQKDRSVFTAY